MKQKLQDLKVLLQRDRKVQIFTGLGALAALWLVFGDQAPRNVSQAPHYIEQPQANNRLGSEEAYHDLITAFKEDQTSMKASLDQLSKDQMGLRTDLNDNVERTAEIFKKILERLADSETGGGAGRMGGSSPIDVSSDGSIAGMPGSELGSDELGTFGSESPDVAPPPAPAQKRIAFVGTGDSVRVKLLAGVNAPTDGSPYPVVFQMISDVHGPDGSALPLGEARVMAAAQGSLTDQRALFRLTKLSVRLPDGHRKEVDVDGWIVGEDGIRGMQGLLIDPIGKAIGGVGFAGVLSGVGQGFSQSQLETSTNSFTGSTNQIVAGNTASYAAGVGIQSAAREYSELIRDRVKELTPQVQVLSGREATAVFARSASITGLFESLESEDDGYSSLD